MRALTTLLAAVSCLAASAPSQVVISEIHFTSLISGDDEWIELRNLGSSSVDISTWSLYFATDTPVFAQTYWFAFPADTVIGAQSSLSVHWLAPYQPKTLTEVWTGNTVFHFLFGYGAEELGGAANGALALLSSQNNALMNSASIFRDWVTWGDGWSTSVRPKRESLALQAGLWVAGTSVSTPTPNDSIALIYTAQTEPTAVAAFFHDASPTPVVGINPLTGHNHENASFSVMERPAGTPLQPCIGRAGTAPVVTARSVPTSGNVDFGLHLDNLIPGQLALLILGVSEQQTPWPLAPACSFNVALTPAILLAFSVSTTFIDQPVPLRGVPTTTVYAQAVALETLSAIGFDPGHKIDIGK